MEEKQETKPIRTVLREMAVGDVMNFPAKKILTIRTYCSGLNIVENRKFTTTLVRKDNKLIVKRIS